MYAKYLKTNAWKVRRQEIIDRDICCRLCASEENLQVHHVDGAYKRIGNELGQDLTTLCRDCHEMYHNHKNSR
jgi:5-methylcytosine-specific restriction endonuclease McrA